jgi:putative ABC transport system substrate-binding protein
MSICLRRRDFIAALGGAAAWPLAARAQPGDRVRRIGYLTAGDLAKAFVSAFIQALAGLGWTDGRNLRMDLRWAGGDANRIRGLAQELVALQPDIILAGGNLATVALQRETRTIPIVFVNVGDPVASDIVSRLDRPNGNVTGFGGSEATLAGKWLELLSEIAPGLKRAAASGLALILRQAAAAERVEDPDLGLRVGVSLVCGELVEASGFALILPQAATTILI